MSTEAIIMMIVAMVIIWGGMILTIVRLAKHPDTPEVPFTGPTGHDSPRW